MKCFSLVLLVALAVNIVNSADYCGTALCSNNNHIACGHNGKFDSTCPADATMVPMTAELKALLVNAHNEKRNLIAGGADAKHKPACRMATMEWDDEMAAIAALNVKQCKMNHDKCRNTETFKTSGQNLAWMGYFGAVDSKARLTQAVQMWYDEVKDSSMTYIDSYPSNYQGPAIGHFTVMMAEKNIRLGCAASHYSVPGQGYLAYLVACNYATTNMIGFPIYTSCSRGGSGCTTGTNAAYPNLCSASEVFNVNKWY